MSSTFLKKKIIEKFQCKYGYEKVIQKQLPKNSFPVLRVYIFKKQV